MLREIREVKNDETRKREEERVRDNLRRISSGTTTTYEEAVAFVHGLFTEEH